MNSCFLPNILAAPIGNPHFKGMGVEMPNVRKLIAIWLLLILALPLASIQAQDEHLANVARAHGDLNTFADLLEMSGLATEVDAAMSLTIFAPSDDAFAELPGFAIDYLSNNLELLQQILQYHVLPEAATSDSLPSGDIAGITGPLLSIQLDEMGVSVNDASVTEADIVVGNTVLHIINRVLVPPIELPEVIPSFVDGSIIIAGSSTVFPLSDAIATRFRDEGYSGNITVDNIGSGAGFERFCAEGVTDISNASRPIKDAEVENCHAIGRDVFPVRVGTDALAVVLNSDNDFVDNLSLAQLTQVFSTADTWRDVNPDWPAEPIERFIPGTDSGTFDYFVEEVFNDNKEPILAAARTSLSEDDNVLVTGVSGNPYAVGFFGFAYFDANRDVLTAATIDGIVPEASSVDAGTYPLARPLFMYAALEIIAEKPQVGDFLTYYLKVVNEEVNAVGYFPADPFGLNRAKFLVLAATSN